MDEGQGKDEENNNETNQASWWGSWPTWLQTAKEKSNTALEFMKRDLTEFSQVVQIDAVAAVSSTAAMLKEKLTVNTAESVADKARQSLTSVLGTITDVFAPRRELEDEELMIIRNSEPVSLDWWQSKLYVIRKDPKTYCHEPEGPPEMYENWLESFHPEDHQEEMTEIMVTCSEVRALYDELVPDAVSHLEFWQRYFYRVHLLRKAEAKRADLMRRAEEISIDDIQWGEGNRLDNEDQIQSKLETSFDHYETSQKTVTSISDIPHYKSNIDSRTFSRHDVLEQSSQSMHENASNDNLSKEIQSSAETKLGENSGKDMNLEISDVIVETSLNETNEGNRSSPVESLGKDSSTGDEWEKDFDLELTDSNVLKTDKCEQLNPLKEDEDDWESWK